VGDLKGLRAASATSVNTMARCCPPLRIHSSCLLLCHFSASCCSFQQFQHDEHYAAGCSPLLGVKVRQRVEHGALLAVALALAAQEDIRRAGVRLAHPVAPIVLLLLRQVAAAAVHLTSTINRV